MLQEFTHPELGEEVRSISGYYVPCEEHTLIHKGREVIYILGQACLDTSCCSTSAWSYVQVPGFLVTKHIRGTDTATPVSEVEPIEDQETRDALMELLSKEYPGARIEIW